MTFTITKRPQDINILNLILDQPDLPAIIRNLDTGLLTRLIRYVGLEDSGPIIVHTTAEQLKNVFDEDLWRSVTPGCGEGFDADRFSLWLRVMIENGPSFTAHRVLEIDEDLLILGICHIVRVINPNASNFCMDGDPGDDGFPGYLSNESLSQTLAGYHLISKDERSWDATLRLFAELNEKDGDRLVRLLDRCSQVSEKCNDENGGLLKLLTGAQMLEEDVAAEREKRKEDMGFVTPVSAAFFLDQTRRVSLKGITSEKSLPQAARLYIRAAEAKDDTAGTLQQSEVETAEAAGKRIIPFMDIFRKADLLQDPKQHQLSYDGDDFDDVRLPIARAMSVAKVSDPVLYARRITELSFLSNTLIAGCGFHGRAFNPKEAAEAALSVCNLGSEYLLQTGTEQKNNRSGNGPISDLIKTDHLVHLFQVGWKILFDRIVLATGKAVLAYMEGLIKEALDPEEKEEITGMLHLLRAGILSGRPWKFHGELDYLQVFLDGDTVEALRGLIQEYPTFTESICKTGGLHLSPHIGSFAHIRAFRYFLKHLVC